MVGLSRAPAEQKQEQAGRGEISLGVPGALISLDGARREPQQPLPRESKTRTWLRRHWQTCVIPIILFSVMGGLLLGGVLGGAKHKSDPCRFNRGQYTRACRSGTELNSLACYGYDLLRPVEGVSVKEDGWSAWEAGSGSLVGCREYPEAVGGPWWLCVPATLSSARKELRASECY